jgi:hypothetical protein
MVPPQLPTSHQPLLPSAYLEPLFASLLASPALGLDLATRIWDVVVFEGDAAFVRAVVAIVGKLEGKLYGGREGVLDALVAGQELCKWELGDSDGFMKWMREVGKIGEVE